MGTSAGAGAFSQAGEFWDQSDNVQFVCDIFGLANYATGMKQAAADKNVRNIF